MQTTQPARNILPRARARAIPASGCRVGRSSRETARAAPSSICHDETENLTGTPKLAFIHHPLGSAAAGLILCLCFYLLHIARQTFTTIISNLFSNLTPHHPGPGGGERGLYMAHPGKSPAQPVAPGLRGGARRAARAGTMPPLSPAAQFFNPGVLAVLAPPVNP